MAAPTYRIPGPCTVTYNNVSLGKCKEGLTMRLQTMWKPITCDAAGSTPIDFIFVGRSASVEGNFVEPDAIKAAAPRLLDAYSIFDTNGIGIGKMIYNGASIAPIYSLGKALKVIDGSRYGDSEADCSWEANVCAPIEPSNNLLSSVQEQQLPYAFIIVPDENGKLFSKLPAYLA